MSDVIIFAHLGVDQQIKAVLWILIPLMIFSIPFLVGWNILKKNRPHDAGDCFTAIVLLLIYLGISFFLLIVINEDLPPYGVTNEGFMFHAEKTYGIEKFYNLAQKNLQTQQKKDGYASVSEIPEWRYLRDDQSADEQSILFYFRKARHSNLPLSLTIKSPEKEQFSKEYLEAKLSFWNPNMRIRIDKDDWYRYCNLKLGLFDILLQYLMCLLFALCCIFPLAAAAYKAHNKWLFYGLWVVVPALYIMNIHTWCQQIPALQYERYNPQTALAEISKAENQTTLSALLAHDTALLENDKSKTVIDAPMLCSGKFFTANFLCWDLGKSTYLYYSPVDLIKLKLLTGNAQIYQPQENFYLVSYPDFTRASNNIWYRFAAIQTIAGSLWLAMFVMALKKRRQDKNPPEETEA